MQISRPHRTALWTALYLLLQGLLSLSLLYLFTTALPRPHASPHIVFILFIAANLFFIALSFRLSLRILWSALGFFALYISIQGIADYLAIATSNSARTLAILYDILQLRMALLLSLLFLCNTVLSLRFGKYRSFAAFLLLVSSFLLLTQDQLSLSFESRYWLYRLFWLVLPLLGLILLGLALHPSLRKEPGYVAPQPQRSGSSPVRRLSYFLLLIGLLFGILWWTKISPINWNQTSRASNSGNGLLQKNLSNQFDFSEYLKLDSSLDQDRQLVMMAKLENLREDRPAYLKRFTLSGIKESFFRDPKEPNMPEESPLPLELERGTSIFEMPQYDLRQDKQMDVFLLNINPSSLFVLNYPTQVQTYENWPDSSFSRVYRVDARINDDFFPFGEVLATYPDNIPEAQLAYYTKIPEQYKDIGEFALQILQEQRGEDMVLEDQMPLELAEIFTQYFHREYRYTLKPGIAEDGDQLRHFLYRGKKGYCTYFAFSAGLMLRSLGVPTRIAVGFLLIPQLRILDYYPMFADQAHAWLEVYDPQQGWVTFDPTTFELAPGEELEFGLPKGAEDDLAALTEELLRNKLLNAEGGLNELTPEQNAAQTFLANIFEAFRSKAWLLPTVLLLLSVFVLFLFRLLLGYFALRAGFLTADKKIITAIYYYLMLLNGKSTWKLNQEHPTPCFELLQKYYFAAQFSRKDLASLRHEIKQLSSRGSWNIILMMKVFSQFLSADKDLRSWHKRAQKTY